MPREEKLPTQESVREALEKRYKEVGSYLVELRKSYPQADFTFEKGDNDLIVRMGGQRNALCTCIQSKS